MSIKFGSFSDEEIRQFLNSHDIEEEVDQDGTKHVSNTDGRTNVSMETDADVDTSKVVQKWYNNLQMISGVQVDYKATLTLIFTCLGLVYVIIPCNLKWFFVALAGFSSIFVVVFASIAIYESMNVVSFVSKYDELISYSADPLKKKMSNLVIYITKIVILMVFSLGLLALLGFSSVKCDRNGIGLWLTKWVNR